MSWMSQGDTLKSAPAELRRRSSSLSHFRGERKASKSTDMSREDLELELAHGAGADLPPRTPFSSSLIVSARDEKSGGAVPLGVPSGGGEPSASASSDGPSSTSVESWVDLEWEQAYGLYAAKGQGPTPRFNLVTVLREAAPSGAAHAHAHAAHAHAHAAHAAADARRGSAAVCERLSDADVPSAPRGRASGLQVEVPSDGREGLLPPPPSPGLVSPSSGRSEATSEYTVY